MYTIINCSPKLKRSNSKIFIDEVTKNLSNYTVLNLEANRNKILEYIYSSDTLLFAFPTYLDSPPSKLLSLLDYIFDNKLYLNNKKIYLIANCGFIEYENNICPVEIIKNWISIMKGSYMGSLLIGSGEIIGNKKFKLLSKNCMKELKKFSMCIKRKEKYEDTGVTIDYINTKLLCILSNIAWPKSR